MIGPKAKTVVSVLVKSGTARDLPVFKTASLRGIPFSRFTLISSETTMALSTNMPNAIIIVARDIRCSSMPNTLIITMPNSITSGMNEPTIKPTLNPKSSITIVRTMATLSITLTSIPLTDFLIRVGWNVAKSSL